MGSTNFLQFNPTQANQENDAAYLTDATRTGGAAVDGIWPSNSANKTLYQVSTFIAAFGQMMANKNFNVSDASLATLTSVLANVLTTADIPGGLQVVGWSGSIALNAALYSGFQIPLQGATTLSISGQVAGQIIGLIFVQDATGGRTVTFPVNSAGGVQPDPTPNIVSAQLFKVMSTGTLQAVGPNVSSSAMSGPLNAVTLTIAGAAPLGYVPTGDGTHYVPQTGPANVTPNFVTGARAFNTQYQNTGANPMLVSVVGSLNLGVGHNASAYALIGAGSASNPVSGNSVTNGPGYAGVTFQVPPGWYYEVQTDVFTDTNSLTLVAWTEWTY